MTQQAVLALEDGSVFYGQSIGVAGDTTGEVVFNTAMTGYQEILTDPSYAKQIVTLTFPHIGNTGCNTIDEESARPMAAGLIVRDVPLLHSNWRSSESLSDYLQRHGIIAIAEIDTRRLTRILREKGAQGGCIIAGEMVAAEQALGKAKQFPGMRGQDLAREVTTDTTYEWVQGSYDLDSQSWGSSDCEYHVVAYDFGIKRNILRMLSDRGCRVSVVPATTPAADVLGMQPDGVFLSNGPGDPEPCDYAITAIQEILLTDTPVFGICLGVQLLGLAVGAESIKMKFGHHGANHPVQDLDSRQVLITSQNHGFALDEQSLPGNVRATHRSLFDGSLQGIELTDGSAFGFQGHPEASPGPHDIAPLFDRFITMMKAARV
ncbi:MAG: glutamine-hydrolyzing carbamoyl-phosphate synthase small subunit [Gammaproteobacteria bacterium]|nr:MAG: glutamine-hydrolyzing carbamoyl-phosphate synthase small subunit [Gammaproteobacteria bacterium]